MNAAVTLTFKKWRAFRMAITLARRAFPLYRPTCGWLEHIKVTLYTAIPVSHVDIYSPGAGSTESPILTLQGQDYVGNNIYVANEPFLTYYEAGQTPTSAIYVQPGNNEYIAGHVTLTGYLVNLSE
jgi:hypothetical protein